MKKGPILHPKIQANLGSAGSSGRFESEHFLMDDTKGFLNRAALQESCQTGNNSKNIILGEQPVVQAGVTGDGSCFNILVVPQ